MPRRVLSGTVVSLKNTKTLITKVERRFRHPIYKKILKVSKKYAVHNDYGSMSVGDKVSFIETRPISKTKRWILLEKLV